MGQQEQPEEEQPEEKQPEEKVPEVHTMQDIVDQQTHIMVITKNIWDTFINIKENVGIGIKEKLRTIKKMHMLI